MVEVPWPISTNPGKKPQEGVGRLINVFAEPRGDGTPVWRRAPGATVFARTPSSGSAVIEFSANARGATFLSTFFELIGSTTTQITLLSTGEVAYPAGTESGDIVFLLSANDGSEAAWVTPTGFTQLVASTSGDSITYSLFYKASTGETTVSLISPTSNRDTVCLAFTIRGAMSTAPICDTGTLSTGASGDPDASDITLTTADGLAVAVGWLDDDSITTCSPPTSFGGTLFAATTGGLVAGSTGASVMVAFQPRPSSGAVTVSSFATDGDDIWAAYSFTVRHD